MILSFLLTSCSCVLDSWHWGSLQNSRGRARVSHAVVVIFLEFFAWGLLTTPMLTVSKPYSYGSGIVTQVRRAYTVWTHTSSHFCLLWSSCTFPLCVSGYHDNHFFNCRQIYDVYTGSCYIVTSLTMSESESQTYISQDLPRRTPTAVRYCAFCILFVGAAPSRVVSM